MGNNVQEAAQRPQHGRAILLPVTVTGVIPALLLAVLPFQPLWGADVPLNVLILAAGIALVVLGIGLLVATVRMFAVIGKGTLAPWDATRHLVVEGVYRYVRNPMHSGVFAILLGETLLTGSTALVIMTVVIIVLHLFYIPLSEERGLEARFGEEYRVYKLHVPRWIPRRSPWQQHG